MTKLLTLTHVMVGFILRRILYGASFTKLYKLIFLKKKSIINYCMNVLNIT